VLVTPIPDLIMTFSLLPGLPNEVLTNILGNLKNEDLLNASLVSKRFRELAQAEFWTDLCLKDVLEAKTKSEMLLSQERCQTLFHCCRNLRNLGITGIDSRPRRSDAIEALADYAIRNCKKISRLEINSGFIPNTDEKSDEDPDDYIEPDINPFSLELFKTIEEHGQNIREIDFGAAFIKINEMLEMPTVLGQITSLRLDQSYYHSAAYLITDVIENLGRLCPNLQHLDLLHYYTDITRIINGFLDEEEYSGLRKNDIEILLSGTKESLVSLKLGSFAHGYVDEVEQSPFRHCTKLERLHVRNGINGKDIMAIGRLGSLLEFKMDVESQEPDLDNIADEDYQNAFAQGQLINLQHFETNDELTFEALAFNALLQYCPNLTSLVCDMDIALTELVTDLGPQSINLQKLMLSTHWFNLNELIAVTNLCNLRELKISSKWDPGHIEDYTCHKTIFPPRNLTNLETLTLDSFDNLDRTVFEAIIAESSKLQEVNLKCLPELSGYAEIFKEFGLKNLKTLRAEKCPHLRGPDIAALNQSCPKLEKIYLSDIGEWSSEELVSLLRVAKEQSDLMAKLQVPDEYKKMFSCLDEG
jgi:hypothetical protein